MADGEPEDWPAQPEGLRQLDRALRCAVCYDLYTGPVVLPCSHSCKQYLYITPSSLAALGCHHCNE